MTKTEQEVFDYAQSVEWDYGKIIAFVHSLDNQEWRDLGYKNQAPDVKAFIEKHKPMYSPNKLLMINEPESITLPIGDYNRLRKLEIKKQIKKLKKELKGL